MRLVDLELRRGNLGRKRNVGPDSAVLDVNQCKGGAQLGLGAIERGRIMLVARLGGNDLRGRRQKLRRWRRVAGRGAVPESVPWEGLTVTV
jgi:hypothetical protein